jgi:hypothetical protein|tara:strand:- start:257 stop:496 length:240 start_codon:yes stop_codon:yes gene_type:complete
MNDKDKSSVEKRSFGEKFKRKVLGLGRPLTIKERMEVERYRQELKLDKMPKKYVMPEKQFKERQAARRKIKTIDRYLNK